MIILNVKDIRIGAGLLVDDIDSMVRFYRDTLGFHTEWADVDTEYERLSKLGLQFPTGEPITYPFGIRNFYVADPEGNLLEMMEIVFGHDK